MNPPRFDRFSQPHFLQLIGRERVTQILLPYANELLGLGMALPAAALPDGLFFQVLATLPRRVDGVSAKLLEAMVAIEVLDEVFPDERTPLVVTELRFRLRSAARPILLQATAGDGTPLDGSIELVTEQGVKESIPPQDLLAEMREQRALLTKLHAQIGSMAKELPSRTEPVSDDAAVAVFALMKKLDDGSRTRKAPLGRVFRLLILEGHSQAVVAEKCQCTRSLISLRVAEIERRMNRPLSELRLLATRLVEINTTVQDSRARKIYQRGLIDDAGNGEE
jgi:uncharacterized coiled-coil protein SlyX